MIAAAVTVGSFTYGFNNSVIAPVYGEYFPRLFRLQQLADHAIWRTGIPAFFDYFGLSAEAGNQRTASLIGGKSSRQVTHLPAQD
jgi:hypothetical protein